MLIDVIPCIPPNEPKVFYLEKSIEFFKRGHIVVKKIPHLKRVFSVFMNDITCLVEEFYALKKVK